MQRRHFLRRGLLGGALLAVAGSGILVLRPGNVTAPRRALGAIDVAQFSVLVAVAARIVDGTGADPIEIAHRVDAALLRMPLEARTDIGQVLVLLENAFTGLLLRARPTPFTRLAPEAQDRALLAWRDSPVALLTGAYHALRKLCLAAHYATPDGWVNTGYTPMIPKPDPPPIEARKPLSPPFIVETDPSEPPP